MGVKSEQHTNYLLLYLIFFNDSSFQTKLSGFSVDHLSGFTLLKVKVCKFVFPNYLNYVEFTWDTWVKDFVKTGSG